MPAPRPIKLTASTATPSSPAAVPMTLTGSAQVANQANAGTLADLAAAQAAINTLTAKVNALLAALRTAGILVP